MPQYINKVTGQRYTFQAAPEAGVNVDASGIEVHLIQTTNGWLDVLSGNYIIPSPSWGASVSYLLDTYPAFAAYSTRQLSSTATNCMRVREATGSTEADIGFSGGWVDEAAIAAHCNGALGYVVTWYDQSGNGYDATQATPGNQPQIYNGSAVLQKNGKPSLDFGAGSGVLLDVTGLTAQAQPITFFSVVSHVNSIDTGYPFSTTTPVIFAQFGTTGTYNINAGSTLSNAGGYSGQLLASALFNTTSSSSRINGAEVASGSVGTNNFGTRLIVGNTTTSRAIDEEQELIVYNSDQTANFSAIETDINTAFSVY